MPESLLSLLTSTNPDNILLGIQVAHGQLYVPEYKFSKLIVFNVKNKELPVVFWAHEPLSEPDFGRILKKQPPDRTQNEQKHNLYVFDYWNNPYDGLRLVLTPAYLHAKNTLIP